MTLINFYILSCFFILTAQKIVCYNQFVVGNTEEYPSPVEGIGLENRQVVQATQGFESLFLRHLVYIAGWSSLVARWAHNPEVVGSNPSPATNWFRGVAVITSACHAEDREFDSRRNRHLAS